MLEPGNKNLYDTKTEVHRPKVYELVTVSTQAPTSFRTQPMQLNLFYARRIS